MFITNNHFVSLVAKEKLVKISKSLKTLWPRLWTLTKNFKKCLRSVHITQQCHGKAPHAIIINRKYFRCLNLKRPKKTFEFSATFISKTNQILCLTESHDLEKQLRFSHFLTDMKILTVRNQSKGEVFLNDRSNVSLILTSLYLFASTLFFFWLNALA